AAIQEISARIGRVTGHGIAGNIRRHYSAWLLRAIVVLLLAANIINLGADLGAMGEALRLLVGGPPQLYVVAFAVGCALLEIFVRYERYVSILKWTSVSLFAYVAAALVVDVPWARVAYNLVVPTLSWDKDYIVAIVAVLGTTITPYCFFWQSLQEAEDERVDPAAHALIGALAVPVLAGSAAYALGEALDWPTGLARNPLDAKAFYGAIAAATLVGFLINFVHLDPIKALFWSAVINGVVAVPLMVVIMLM